MLDIKYLDKYFKYILIPIMILGTWLRLYEFPNIPVFSDEIRESLVTYDLVKFHTFPLTNYAEYIGPIYNYLLAILMWLTGINVWMPRIFVLAAGIITIYAAYLLGKTWGNRKIGLITALYVAMSPTLILINSRISWATCLAPLFVCILLVWLKKFTVDGTHTKAGLLGIISGVLLQLHPLMIFIFLPTFVSWLLFIFRNHDFKNALKHFLFFGTFGLLMLVPMLIANIKDPFISIKGAEKRQHLSENNLEPTFKSYLINLDREISQTEHLIKSAVIFEDYIIPEFEYKPIYYIDSWDEFLFLSVIAGCILIFVRKKWQLMLFPIIIVFFMLGAPFLTTDYFEGLKIRYYAVFIPIFGFLIGYSFDYIFNITSKFKFIQIIYVALFLTMLTSPPAINLYKFFVTYEDRAAVDNDLAFIKEQESIGHNFYYIANSDYDYSMVEYLLKFSAISEDKISIFNSVSDIKNDGILLLPDEIDSIENAAIATIFVGSDLYKIYAGDNIYAYIVQ